MCDAHLLALKSAIMARLPAHIIPALTKRAASHSLAVQRGRTWLAFEIAMTIGTPAASIQTGINSGVIGNGASV